MQQTPDTVSITWHGMRSEKTKSSNAIESSLTTDSGSNSNSLPSIVCIDRNDAAFDAMVSQLVKEHIFPKKQFIVLERELDEHSKLADKCVKELQIQRTEWYSVRNKIRKALNRKRNNAQLSVRRSLQSKYIRKYWRCCTQVGSNECILSFIQSILRKMVQMKLN